MDARITQTLRVKCLCLVVPFWIPYSLACKTPICTHLNKFSVDTIVIKRNHCLLIRCQRSTGGPFDSNVSYLARKKALFTIMHATLIWPYYEVVCVLNIAE